MTGAVGSVAHTTRIVYRMATLTAFVEDFTMQRDPVRILMAVRFRSAVDFHIGGELIRSCNHGDGMANVALQSDGITG